MKKRYIILTLLSCWLGYSMISTNLVLYSPYYLREQGVLTEQVLLERFVKDTSYVERFTPENMRVKTGGYPVPIYNLLHKNSGIYYLQPASYELDFNNFTYIVSLNGDLIEYKKWTEDKGYVTIPITSQTPQQFKHDFYLFMSPITDNPTKPLLDLQWLYNLIYPRK